MAREKSRYQEFSLEMYPSQSSQPLSENLKPRPSETIQNVELRLSCKCGNVFFVPFSSIGNELSSSRKTEALCQCGETFVIEVIRQTKKETSDSHVELSIRIQPK